MRQIDIMFAKAMAWERAKGELRAVAIAEGHRRLCDDYRTPEDVNGSSPKWVALEGAIEEFIKHIEDEALHE